MRSDKTKAIQLRKSGKSYSEIKSQLSIPKSTLSNWFKSTAWSENVRISLIENTKNNNKIRIEYLNKVRGKRLDKLYRQAQEEAKVEFEKLKYHPLFIAGIIAYWGEGEKTTLHNVRISNVDPYLIRIFVDFCIKICGINENKIKLSLLLYPDLSEATCLSYWVQNIGLNKEHFNKSTIIQGRHKTKRVAYGMCIICISSRYFKEKMLVWLKLLPQELISSEYYLRE